MIFVHDFSIVDDEVNIGDGTKVWAFSHLMGGSVIGNNCMIGEGVHIGNNVRIGNGCRIQNHAILYNGVVLEDNVFIGPNVVTTNDIEPNAYDDGWTDRFKKTIFKRGCSVGANATIVCGNTIGKNSLVGAGSVVISDVEDFCVVVGNPARVLRYKK